MKLNYREPENLLEADHRIEQIRIEIAEIDLQLSDPNRTDMDGNRLGMDEYHQWKRKAQWARLSKEEEIRRLKSYQRLQRERNPEVMDSLVQVTELLESMQQEGVDFHLDELKVLEQALVLTGRKDAA